MDELICLSHNTMYTRTFTSNFVKSRWKMVELLQYGNVTTIWSNRKKNAWSTSDRLIIWDSYGFFNGGKISQIHQSNYAVYESFHILEDNHRLTKILPQKKKELLQSFRKSLLWGGP